MKGLLRSLQVKAIFFSVLNEDPILFESLIIIGGGDHIRFVSGIRYGLSCLMITGGLDTV